MLHRSFKPAKCKTALKLSVSRIKLLKNKREAHLRQARRELAQLLDSGQERTARIRVEHVVREEKTLAAYDLLEVYCELIAARLPIIESQKNCPIDLKEAITSVIFASPRCDDLPELLDIRKHLQAKYGKEFTIAALELRPGCGVGRMLIEKLSTVAPDIQTKTKILCAIAEEHNIKWDPSASGENENPPEDLLNGPNTFQTASEKYAESQSVQAPINNTQRHDTDVSRYGQNSAPNSQELGSTTMSSSSHPQMATPSTRGEGTEHLYSFSGDEGQNWNMDFKDATSAAHAAAEAAERASMAARAAVQLSSGGKFTRQHSSESQSLSVNASLNETLGKRAAKFMNNVTVATEPADNKVLDRNPVVKAEPTRSAGQTHAFHRNERLETHKYMNVMQTSVRAGTNSNSNSSFNRRAPKDERTEVIDPGYQTVVNEQFDSPSHAKRSSRSDSLKSSTSCREDDMFTEGSCEQDRYSQTMPFDEQSGYQGNHLASEEGPEKRSSYFENETEHEDINHFADEIMRGQPSNVSSPTHSAKSDEVADPYIIEFDDRIKEKYHTQHTGTAVFDQSGSDTDEGYNFDTLSSFRDEQPDPLMSPDQIHESPRQNVWLATKTKKLSYEVSPFQSVFIDNESSSPETSSKMAESKGSSDFPESLPVTFDLSDNESEPEMPCHDASPTYSDSSKHEKLHIGSMSSSPFREISDERLEQQMETSSSDGDNSLPTMESTLVKEKNERKIDQPGLGTGKELKLGMLSGGFRNKGYRQPPYIKNPSREDLPFPSEQEPENGSSSPVQVLVSPTAESSRKGLYKPRLDNTTDMNSSPRLQTTVYDLEDDSVGKLPQITVRHNKERRPQDVSLVVSNTSFTPRPMDADIEDPENDDMTTVRVSHNKPRLGSGLSRRTKPSTLDGQRKTSRETYGAASSPTVQKQTTTIKEEQLEELPRVTKLATNISGSEAASKRSKQPSSARKQPEYSSNVIKPSSSAGTGNPSNLKAQQQPPSRQDSTGKASHVHPKLPDFDTLAAHLNTFRINKQ